MGIQIHVIKHEVGKRVADNAVKAIAKAKPESYAYKEQSNDSQRNKILQHGAYDILLAYHAPIKERQAGSHQQY